MDLDLQAFLEKYYDKDEKIILACSTGPDSMFLLYKLLETTYRDQVVACYFNHKLRKEADEEEDFLKNLGKKLGFKVEVGFADIKKIKDILGKSISIEELSRQERYAFLSKICKIYKTKKILTAHHLDDRIETFFFNLARGSKLTGLINMTESSGEILRPLLSIEKSEILKYLDDNKLEYRIDKTNFQTDITRNYIRNEIIPKFQWINKKFKQNIKNTLLYFEELKDYIDSEIATFLGGKRYFEVEKFNSKPGFLQKEIIRYIYYISNGNSTIGLSKANIAEIIKFINGKGSKTIKKIRNLNMQKDGSKIRF